MVACTQYRLPSLRRLQTSPCQGCPPQDRGPHLVIEGLVVDPGFDDAVGMAQEFGEVELADIHEALIGVGDASGHVGDADDGMLIQGLALKLRLPQLTVQLGQPPGHAVAGPVAGEQYRGQLRQGFNPPVQTVGALADQILAIIAIEAIPQGHHRQGLIAAVAAQERQELPHPGHRFRCVGVLRPGGSENKDVGNLTAQVLQLKETFRAVTGQQGEAGVILAQAAQGLAGQGWGGPDDPPQGIPLPADVEQLVDIGEHAKGGVMAGVHHPGDPVGLGQAA